MKEREKVHLKLKNHHLQNKQINQKKNMIFNDNSEYNGELRDGLPHGEGKMGKILLFNFSLPR